MSRKLKRAISCALGFTTCATPLAFWRWQANPNVELPKNLVRVSDAFDADRAFADLIALEAKLPWAS